MNDKEPTISDFLKSVLFDKNTDPSRIEELIGGDVEWVVAEPETEDSVEEEPEEQQLMDVEISDVELIYDDNHIHSGKAVFDPETKIVTCYMRTGEDFQGLKTDFVVYALQRGRFVMPLERAANVEYDPSLQHTCIWYNPPAAMAEVYGSRPSENYQLDRFLRDSCVCSQYDIVKEAGSPLTPCGHQERMVKCSHYTPSATYEVESKVIGDVPVLLTRTRRGIPAADEYTLSIKGEPVQVFSPWELELEAEQVALAATAEAVEELVRETGKNSIDVELNPADIPVRPTSSYLNHVMAANV